MLIVFFLIVGLVDCCRVMVHWLLRPTGSGRVTMLLNFEGHNEEAEYILRSAAERICWMGGKEEKKILCVDRGMDQETREICERLAREYPFIYICEGEIEKERQMCLQKQKMTESQNGREQIFGDNGFC